MARSKIFLVIYFFPAYLSSILMWGDPRTSFGFLTPPEWYSALKWCIQVGAILVLFIPLKFKSHPSYHLSVLSFLLIFSASGAEPIHEAESILVDSAIKIGILSLFLSIAKPAASFDFTDLKFLFFMFLIGFLLQVLIASTTEWLPSHSVPNLFVRFNGITNDSLATGMLLTLLIPWVVRNRFRLILVSILIMLSLLTGSLFSVVAVTSFTVAYLFRCRYYWFVTSLVVVILSLSILLIEKIFSYLVIKHQSILTHLRFFLDAIGFDTGMHQLSCSQKFCESFLEASLHLTPIFTMSFYGLIIVLLLSLFCLRQHQDVVMVDSLKILGLTVLIASLVHPVVLIPFVTHIFIILTIIRLSAGKILVRVTAGADKNGSLLSR